VTLIEAIDFTKVCVANPVAMAEAIVPHPKKPIRKGASGSVNAMLVEDNDEVLVELAWGAIVGLVVVVVKARVQDSNSVDTTTNEEEEEKRSIWKKKEVVVSSSSVASSSTMAKDISK
jgi:hypothetical protein